MPRLAIERPRKSAASVRNFAITYRHVLDGEAIASATAVEVGSSDLTIGSVGASEAAKEINGEQVPAGQAVVGRVSGGEAGRKYRIRVTVVTDAEAPQTFVDDYLLLVD